MPFGKIILTEIRNQVAKRTDICVNVYVWKTTYGQTIFLKKISKVNANIQKFEQNVIEKEQRAEFSFTTQKLINIKNKISKVSDTNDFVEILCEIMQLKINKNLSKEQIDEIKVKWKRYKLTKKQIESIYELL